MARTVVRVVDGRDTSDGAGVRLRRSIGTPELDHLDPFLLFDEFKSDTPDEYLAGFPDHPHRGFETVTYMLAGSMEHRDHKGNHGLLTSGSVQWMTAGRGIIHSEMPRQQDGLMWGFQLWVNLPAAHKLDPPRYQDIPPERVPEHATPEGGQVRVVAGGSNEGEGAVRGIFTAPLYLDVRLPAGAASSHAVPAGHNAFVYVYQGTIEVGPGKGVPLSTGQLGVLSDGDSVEARAVAPARFLVVAARPLNEPIARYGPFVMNTREEIVRAFRDFQEGTFLDDAVR
jgi:redox-sensitive bicupin YhaK (pirin superfamily)